MKSGFRLPAILLTAALTAPPALAHHAFQAEFDGNAPVVLKGKISSVQWTNPHTLILMTVEEPGAAPKTWAILAGTPNSMLRLGLCRTNLPVGAEVTIQGWRTRDPGCESARSGPNGAVWPVPAGTCKAGGNSITFADGKTARIGYGQVPGGSVAVEPNICGGGAAG